MNELFGHLSESARLRNVGLREGSPDQQRDDHGRWSAHGGGTSAAPGKLGHTMATKHGTYSVSPISNKHGRHLGYATTFQNDKGALPGGLHQTVTPEGTLKSFMGHEPVFRHPNQAKRAAMTHAKSMTRR